LARERRTNPRLGASSYATKLSGKYSRRVIKGRIGRNLQREAPQAFAEAAVTVNGYWSNCAAIPRPLGGLIPRLVRLAPPAPPDKIVTTA
jgi:hypothetical protein